MSEIYRFTTVEELREELFRRPLEEFIAVRLDDRGIELMPDGLKRLEEVASDCDATISYCHYRERLDDGRVENHPVIDYQLGSLRDDFDFGPLVLLNRADILSASDDFGAEESAQPDGGWYALRLRMSIGNIIAMVPEYLYTTYRVDNRKSGEKQHDYVNPRNASYQKAMEQTLLEHLFETDSLVDPATFDPVNFDTHEWPVEASVVIPVRNRVATISDAVRSALGQLTDFEYNVIVVDNGSTDGTREELEKFNDPRLHVIKVEESEGLGIGGCWNRALLSEHCGRFAIQLDSDDVYSDCSVVEQIVEKFHKSKAAMVIGSYMMSDFNLNPIPPGLIDHKEWTPENGMNNALRVNGFGAPRAYYTGIARQLLFPNVSYGEDYAMCLRISRDYPVARIYDCLYFCRRWEGNSDAALPIEKVNEHNSYKDFLRSVEYLARSRANAARRGQGENQTENDNPGLDLGNNEN